MIPRKQTLLSLMVMLCAIVFSSCEGVALAQEAQSPVATVKEQLPNGEFIVVIDGVEQRTLTAEHAMQIAERNADLDKCQRARAVIDQELQRYDQLVALAKKDAELADKTAIIERERAARIETMYNSEYALRLKAEQLNNAHGRVGKFFDNPWVQIGFKAVVPAVNLARSFTR